MQVKDSNSRDPSAMELPNARGGIFSFPQTAPPPTASHCWTGSGHVNVEGTKAETPSPPCAARLVADWEPWLLQPPRTGTSNAVRLPMHKNAQSEVSASTHFSSSALLTLCMEGCVMAKRKEIILQRHLDLDLWRSNYLGMRNEFT